MDSFQGSNIVEKNALRNLISSNLDESPEQVDPVVRFFTELPSMILRLRTKHLRFVYTFESGHRLVGMVEGDYFSNAPNFVFNLRSLKAHCFNPQGSVVMCFDDVFGQLNVDQPEAILSGMHSEQGSFFSFNYRNDEATIYDAMTDTWIATGWNPHFWQVEELAKTSPKPPFSRLDSLVLSGRAIA